MKKSLTIAMAVVMIPLSCLGGSAVQKSTLTKNEQFELQFSQAVTLFDAKEYTQAYPLLVALFDKKTDDEKINFYLGRCATELKLYDQAVLAFERVLMMNPDHVRSHLEMGRIFFEQGQNDDAQMEFETVLEKNPPVVVRNQVLSLLAEIENSKKKHFISGAFIAGVMMDSNVKNDIGLTTYVPPVIGLQLNGNKPVYDMAFTETLALNHQYKTKSPYSWQNSLVIFNQGYERTPASNVLFMQASSGLGYKSGKIDLLLSPVVEKLKYGFGLADMMAAVGFNQKLTYGLSERVLINQTASLKRQFFYSSNSLMGSNLVDGTLGMKYKLSDNGKIAGVTVGGSRAMKINDDPSIARTDVTQTTKFIRFEYSMPFEKYFDFSGAYTMKTINYQDVDQSFGDTRGDFQRALNVTLVRPIAGSWVASLAANRIWNTSNFATGVYQKDTLTLSFIKGF